MTVRIRDMKNLPLFYEPDAEVIGQVERGVIGDDLRLAYIVVKANQGEWLMINGKDLILTDESVIIHDKNSMKSYQHGEELSVYQKKLGDRIYDHDGREIGVVSDFIIHPDKKVHDIEVSSGVINDLLQGRTQVDIEQVNWKSITSGLIEGQGSDVI